MKHKKFIGIALFLLASIAVMVSSCKKEFQRYNKASGLLITDSDIVKLAQKHNNYLTEIIKNYNYDSVPDYIENFEKNFINTALDGLSQTERIQIIENMKKRHNQKNNMIPITSNDLILAIDSCSKFENKDKMIELVNTATSIIIKDTSTCAEINSFLDSLFLEKSNNFTKLELIVLKSYFETLKASANFWYPIERGGTGIGYAYIQKLHGDKKANIGPLGSALISDASSLGFGMIGVAIAGAVSGPIGWSALAIVAGESAANSGLAAVVASM